MSHIFISYSRKDLDIASKIVSELEKHKLDTWIDWKNIPKRLEFDKEIFKGIEEADAFLFLISPDSIQSEICNQEIAYALANNKRVVTVLIREINKENFPPSISKINWIDCKNIDSFVTAIEEVSTAIHTDYSWVQAHRRLQVKALEWERNPKENSFLLRGKDLQDAELQLVTNSSKDPPPTDLQREYIFTSRKSVDRQIRITTGISIAAAITLAGLAVFGFVQAGRATTNATASENNAATAQAALTQAVFNANEAQTQAAIAQAASTLAVEQSNIAIANDKKSQIARAADLASQSLIVSDTNFSLSMLLSVEAFNTYETVETLGLLMNNVFAPPELLPSKIKINDYTATLVFSPDGKILATSNYEKINLWDSKTWQSIAVLEGQKDVYNLVFSPDGKFIVSSSALDDNIIVWNIEKAQAVGRLKNRFTNNGTDLEFSPNGEFIAESGNGTINIWDVDIINNNNPLQRPNISINGGSFAFSPNGKLLATSQDNIIILRDPTTGFAIGQPLGEHTTYITSITFSPDGKIIASTDGAGITKLWDAVTYKQIGQSLNADSSHNFYHSSVFSPDSKSLLIGYESGNLIIWDIRSEQKIAIPIKLKNNAFALSPDGKTLVSGYDYGIGLWNVGPLIMRSDQHNIQPVIFNVERVEGLAFSPDGKTLAVSETKVTEVNGNFDFESFVKFLDIETGEIINQIGNQFTGNYNNIIYDLQENVLAIRDEGSPSHFFVNNIKTGQLVMDFDIEKADSTKSIYMAQDMQKIIFGNYDGTVSIWNTTTKQLIGRPIEVYNDEVISVALSPNENTLASSSRGGSVTLTNVSTGKLIGQLQNPYGGDLLNLAYSHDGKILASVGGDGTVLLWYMDTSSWLYKVCQQAGRNFTYSEWLQYFPSEEYLKTCEQWDLGPKVIATPTVIP